MALPTYNKNIVKAIAILHKIISRIYTSSISSKKIKHTDILRIKQYYKIALAYENRKRSVTVVIDEEKLFIDLFDKNYTEDEDWNEILKNTINEYKEMCKNDTIAKYDKKIWEREKGYKFPKRFDKSFRKKMNVCEKDVDDLESCDLLDDGNNKNDKKKQKQPEGN